MMALENLAGVAIISLGMVLTPGPNMIYLTSRTISQGRLAGMISLAGVALGFVCYLLAAGLGLAALFKAVPVAYDVVRIAGAFYLGYLAWNMLKPRGASPFEARELPPHSPRRLFTMGLVTNLLNPKMVTFTIAFLPQFVDPHRGQVWLQFAVLGAILIVLEFLVDGTVGLLAGRIGHWLRSRRTARRTIDTATGGIFIGLGVRLALLR